MARDRLQQTVPHLLAILDDPEYPLPPANNLPPVPGSRSQHYGFCSESYNIENGEVTTPLRLL